MDGSDCTNGATNVTVRFASSGGLATGQSNCLAGERATGGGFGISPLSSVRFTISQPVPATTGSVPTGWTVTATEPEFFSIYVICAAP